MKFLDALIEDEDTKAMMVDKIAILSETLTKGKGGFTFHMGIREGNLVTKIHWDMEMPVEHVGKCMADMLNDLSDIDLFSKLF